MNIAKKTGNEPIMDNSGRKVSIVRDYWAWAYSSLIGNTERGRFAEYLVATALGVNHGVRSEWDKYDLKTDSDISVEVKASGYIQSWKQRELSKPVFSIKPTRAWDSETHKYNVEAKRQADVYVFCLHNYEHKDVGLNPLDMNQWEFYVIATKKLNEIMPTQKTVSLSKLKRLNVIQCNYDNLKQTIENAVNK
ncbi:hypothetical protein [Anaerovibrio lipolyticus]|uniref:hypothetical protein n=1 Tax=Anaerovibrio lipolyticus TaxID=82374 RepID=UPI0004895340|nr:hypothetical protein [Anaerovibrio lipolyticus]